MENHKLRRAIFAPPLSQKFGSSGRQSVIQCLPRAAGTVALTRAVSVVELKAGSLVVDNSGSGAPGTGCWIRLEIEPSP